MLQQLRGFFSAWPRVGGAHAGSRGWGAAEFPQVTPTSLDTEATLHDLLSLKKQRAHVWRKGQFKPPLKDSQYPKQRWEPPESCPRFSRSGGVGLVVGLDDLRGLFQP